MIKSFRHKGLRRFYEVGSAAGIQSSHKKRLRIQLVALDTATTIEDMDIPGFKLHLLKGDRKGLWSLLSHILPLPPGEGWGEGIKLGQPPDSLSPLPDLLPEGEGTQHYTVMYGFHVLSLSTTPCNVIIHGLTVVAEMQVGQQWALVYFSEWKLAYYL